MLANKKIFLFLFAFFLVWLIAAACGPRINTYPGLKKKGLLPLSDNNAFNGANLFLAKEMEKSAFLHNFIKGKGAPTAIELEESTYGPTQLLMFYAKHHAVYIAVPQQEHIMREWIIRGPYQMEWKDDKEMQRLQRLAKNEPVLYLWGKEQRFPVNSIHKPETIVRVALPPTPKPTPIKRKPRKVSKSSKKKASDALPKLDPKDFQNLNTDQRALLIAQGYAPRADNGDVIHVVKYENETLHRITNWYTESDKNEEQIAKLNNLTPGQAVPLGTQIRIPLELLKRLKSMPSTFK